MISSGKRRKRNALSDLEGKQKRTSQDVADHYVRMISDGDVDYLYGDDGQSLPLMLMAMKQQLQHEQQGLGSQDDIRPAGINLNPGIILM